MSEDANMHEEGLSVPDSLLPETGNQQPETSQPRTSNIEPQTSENMEVHAHTHTPRKNGHTIFGNSLCFSWQ